MVEGWGVLSLACVVECFELVGLGFWVSEFRIWSRVWG